MFSLYNIIIKNIILFCKGVINLGKLTYIHWYNFYDSNDIFFTKYGFLQEFEELLLLILVNINNEYILSNKYRLKIIQVDQTVMNEK